MTCECLIPLDGEPPTVTKRCGWEAGLVAATAGAGVGVRAAAVGAAGDADVSSTGAQAFAIHLGPLVSVFVPLILGGLRLDTGILPLACLLSVGLLLFRRAGGDGHALIGIVGAFGLVRVVSVVVVL